MANIKDSKASRANFADTWDKEVRKLWPQNYPKSLSNEFKKLNVTSILDCAGGTGYPSIEMKQLGWDITYSDAAEVMLEFFNKRLEETQLDVPVYQARWEALSETIPQTFDALMCAGNSFVGITAYDELSIDREEALPRMKLAMSEFYKMLNPGGVLYIDLFAKECAAPKQPYSQTQDTDSQHIFVTITYDPATNIRTNFTTKTSLVDGTEQDLITKVMPIFAEDLLSLLSEAGFTRIERSTVDDADYVDSFFAFKE